MRPVFIEARDLPDAWFQCVHGILDKGHTYSIDRGSYEGQKRLEFDYVTVHVKYPATRPLIPDIPASLGIPNPVAEGYVEEYLPYLMTPAKAPNEDYTYGERICGWTYVRRAAQKDSTNKPATSRKGGVHQPPKTRKPPPPGRHVVNQLEEVVRMYKEQGFGTNQAAISVSAPSDILLADPPCLRHIDTRVREGRLHFIVYFRSWDLWNGFPANLAALQLLKEYMAGEVGVEDGEMIAASKGLHLYDYAWELAELRAGKICSATP